MNKKDLLKLEKEERAKALLDEWKSTVWAIAHGETGVAFFETKEGVELQGAESAKEHVLKYEQVLRIKRAELVYLEKLLTEKE